MKLLNRSLSLAFTGTSRDYITKDSVKRANARLTNNVFEDSVGLESIYEKHSISRPTREQIASAGAKALRKFATVGQ